MQGRKHKASETTPLMDDKTRLNKIISLLEIDIALTGKEDPLLSDLMDEEEILAELNKLTSIKIYLPPQSFASILLRICNRRLKEMPPEKKKSACCMRLFFCLNSDPDIDKNDADADCISDVDIEDAFPPQYKRDPNPDEQAQTHSNKPPKRANSKPITIDSSEDDTHLAGGFSGPSSAPRNI